MPRQGRRKEAAPVAARALRPRGTCERGHGDGCAVDIAQSTLPTSIAEQSVTATKETDQVMDAISETVDEQLPMTDAEFEAALPNAEMLEPAVRHAVVALTKDARLPMPRMEFCLPFTNEEAKTITNRKLVRHPPPYAHIAKSIYLSKTLPVADLPVHKCNCFVDKQADSSSRSRHRGPAVPSKPSTRGSKAKKARAHAGEQYCGETCHNRMLYISCTKDTCSAPDPALCTNRAIQRRETKPVHVKYVEGPGFGLFADDTIEAGEFIIEYLGEVVDDEECERRLIKCRDKGEQHFYMLEIEKDVVIDARYRSNEARFINHSCDPNSMTQKWNVGGLLRIGIFACRRILPDEEITINYNFSHFGVPIECKCGSMACTGKIGLKRSSDQTVDAVRKVGGSKKALELFETAAAPELKRPVLLTSLALLKSAGPMPKKEKEEAIGFPRRSLFVSHRRREQDHKPQDAVPTPPAASSSGSSPLSSEWSSAAEDDVATTTSEHSGNGQWYNCFQRGDHLSDTRELESFISGGKLDWTSDLQESKASRDPEQSIAAPSDGRVRLNKRQNLDAARSRRFAELMAFANGKSKWSKRVRSSVNVDSARVARFIDNIKHGKQVLNDNLNDLNEDTCGRCGLAGELVCCDSCPAAFHLNCTNLAFLPPDGEPWFCSDCMKQARQRAQSEVAAAASIDGNHNLRQPQRGGHAAPIVPHLKRIFHVSSTKDTVTKRRYRKRAKTSSLSYRSLEHMPLPSWDEDDDDDDAPSSP